MNYPERKDIRLKNYDYSRNGRYFITICTADKNYCLSEIKGVGDGVLDVPNVILTDIGKIVNDQINEINFVYHDIKIEKFVIMPDHVHMIVFICHENASAGGRSGTPSPTNSAIPSLISAFKRFTNKKTGFSIWQRSYYDRIIRSEKEYTEICRYIDNNPINWLNNIFDQNTWR